MYVLLRTVAIDNVALVDVLVGEHGPDKGSGSGSSKLLSLIHI